jgi:hypothetical protein
VLALSPIVSIPGFLTAALLEREGRFKLISIVNVVKGVVLSGQMILAAVSDVTLDLNSVLYAVLTLGKTPEAIYHAPLRGPEVARPFWTADSRPRLLGGCVRWRR